MSARPARAHALNPSWMCSKPFQAHRPMAASSAMSATPCTVTPSSPRPASCGTRRSSTSCHGRVSPSGSVSSKALPVRKATLKVPASSSATHSSRKASEPRPMRPEPGPAKAPPAASSCAASSARNTSAMIIPMPMPKASERMNRAAARSTPITPPV